MERKRACPNQRKGPFCQWGWGLTHLSFLCSNIVAFTPQPPWSVCFPKFHILRISWFRFPLPHHALVHIPRTLANCQFLYAAIRGSGPLVVEFFLKCGNMMPNFFPQSSVHRTCHALCSESPALWAAWSRRLINLLNKWVATTNQPIHQSIANRLIFRKGPACHWCHPVNKYLRWDTKEKHGSRIEIHPNFTCVLKCVSHSCFL